MKFTIDQKSFLDGLQTVGRAVSSKNTLPVLSGVLIKAEEGRLKLVATDLEIGIECYVDAEITTKGELVLPASHLSSIIRELPSMDVEVDCDLKTNSAEIRCGNSHFSINGFPADDFPLLPKVDEGTAFVMCQPYLKEVIEQVKIATSTDETQPFLNGALLRINDQELNMASTNSYRLAHRMMNLEKGINEQLEVIIPNKTLDQMARLLGDDEEDSVKIQITENQILFEMNNILIISRLIEGKFPNYEPVIPKSSETFVKIERKDLLKAAKRVSLIAMSNSNIIKCKIDNGIVLLESADAEIGHAEEKIMVNMEGPAVEISFNSNYLMDGLKVIDSDQVQLCFSGKLSPLVLKPKEDVKYTYVISPIRS